MLFQLKINEPKNKTVQQSISKIERFKSILNKVKFVAKNVIYIKKWSNSNVNLSENINKRFSVFGNSRNFDIRIGCFSIKIMSDSDPLMNNVKELRQRIFFDKSDEKKIDTDEFDKFCDHLVVIDRSVSEDFIVGTYRLLLKPKFVENQKFYSQSEFDISSLLKDNSLTLLEAGRSCVHQDYRDGRIIKLLWRGLATYIVNNNVDLIFGCASFPSSKYKIFSKQLSYLLHFHSPPKSLSTMPLEYLKADYNVINKRSINFEEEFRKLPPLIKAYLRVGAWVGPGAIIDKEFDTTDVLIILKSEKIMKKYSQLSFQKKH